MTTCIRKTLGLATLWSLLVAACTSEPNDDTTATTSTASDATSTSGSSQTTSADTSTGTSNPDDTCLPAFDGVTTSVFTQSSSRFVFDKGDGYAIFSGAYYPQAQPSFHQESAREGFCRLLTYTHVPCDPECGFGQVCASGVCITPVAAQSIGALTLNGVSPDPIALQPDGIFHYSWQSEPFGDTAQSVLTLHGDAEPAFSASVCSLPLVVANGDWNLVMQERQAGADVTLTWQNPLPYARVYVRMTTGIGTHGGISPVEIECEGPDLGALTLPGAYLDQLFDGPFWSCGECGDHRLLRYHASEIKLEGGSALQFRAQSHAAFFFHPRLND